MPGRRWDYYRHVGSRSDAWKVAPSWYFRGPIEGLASKCVDVDVAFGPVVNNGTKVRLWDCNGSVQQTFDYHF